MRVSRRARWAVPAAAVAVTAGVAAAVSIPAAQASPALPAKSAAALLASVSRDAATPPLTGTVTESASLGLPQLPSSGSGSSLISLLAGSHKITVSYQDATHFRLALPQPQQETDVIADGSRRWLWQSAQDAVTEYVPAAGKLPARTAVPAPAALTPQQAATQVLQAVGKTTVVSTQANVLVAGQAAYQLVLAPKDTRSLVGRVVIAVDAKYGLPLRVQLYAREASAPAFQTGFTALSFAAPGASTFAFTPPPGASVSTVKLSEPAGQQAKASPAPSGVGHYGTGWLAVAAFPQQDLSAAAQTGAAASGGKSAAYSAGSNGVGVSTQELLKGLLASGEPAHGSWGSGTLVKTSLFSMLITGGKVYVGAVAPSVLSAAVGHTS
jgi:outer membrane lipoprotein-sorting protein